MWICSCNPFTDKDVKCCLDNKKGETARVSEVYKSCTGGKSPNCGSCIATLKDTVMEHNRNVTVEHLRKAVAQEKTPQEKTLEPQAPLPAHNIKV